MKKATINKRLKTFTSTEKLVALDFLDYFEKEAKPQMISGEFDPMKAYIVGKAICDEYNLSLPNNNIAKFIIDMLYYTNIDIKKKSYANVNGEDDFFKDF